MSRSKVKRFVVAARVFACVLAAAVVLLELLAADGAFHNALHHDGQASNQCVLCLFAKGQMDSPDTAPVFTEFVRVSFQSAPQVTFHAPADVTYLISLGRAPPACFPPLSVLA